MLDQNTDRMWYVIGAVLIGAAIILIANGSIPQMFASVTDSFEDVSDEALSGLEVLGAEDENSMIDGIAPQPESDVDYWDYADFEYSGNTLLGFSEQGLDKYTFDYADADNIELPEELVQKENALVSELLDLVMRLNNGELPEDEAVEEVLVHNQQIADVEDAIASYIEEYKNAHAHQLWIPDINPHESNTKITRIADDAFNIDRVDYFKGTLDVQNVEHIGDSAFRGITFDGGDFVGKHLTHIGDSAFYMADTPSGNQRSAQFDGVFDAPNVTYIGDQAFMTSDFTGELNAPNLMYVGDNALLNAEFTGSFDQPQLTHIGTQGFTSSTFTGTFNAPKVTFIGEWAFSSSQFEGSLYLPDVETIAMHAFGHDNTFSGELCAPKVTKIGNNAFGDNSQFDNYSE